MKSKVISLRVNDDVFNLIKQICDRDKVSKNELLSDIISSNLNMKIYDNNLTSLEKILIKLKSIVNQDYCDVLGEYTPCIFTGIEEDGEYEGKLIILVGDDTCIREKDGKFCVYDFHFSEKEPLFLTEKEILDYYEGLYEPYGVPSLNERSYHYMRGYCQTMSSLCDMIKLDLKKYEDLQNI